MPQTSVSHRKTPIKNYSKLRARAKCYSMKRGEEITNKKKVPHKKKSMFFTLCCQVAYTVFPTRKRAEVSCDIERERPGFVTFERRVNTKKGLPTHSPPSTTSNKHWGNFYTAELPFFLSPADIERKAKGCPPKPPRRRHYGGRQIFATRFVSLFF